MARSYKVIPLYEKDGVLTVAMVDPTNLRSLDHIKFKTGKDVEPVIGTEAEILAAIERAYTGGKEKLSDLIGKTRTTTWSSTARRRRRRTRRSATRKAARSSRS